LETLELKARLGLWVNRARLALMGLKELQAPMGLKARLAWMEPRELQAPMELRALKELQALMDLRA
jgi:hypothetical protein